MEITPREQFIKALHCLPIKGHVPHFELVFFPVMEAVGKVHPKYRNYYQWKQMSSKDRKLQLEDMADTYILTAEKYHHSAIHVHPRTAEAEDAIQLLEVIREQSGDKYFLMVHGDPTPGIPDGDTMMDFSVKMYEEPELIHEQTKRSMAHYIEFAQKLSEKKGLLDGFILCSDYCFNQNPFFTINQFDEFIGPYLTEIIAFYHKLGFYAIKHTDGNIMPILDRLAACGPDALHSLDPQGNVDLKKVKEFCNGRICLIGNVNCGLLQSGSNEDVICDVRRALRDGMPGYGYIFSTSNCIFAGLELERYELMNKIWWQEGIYD